MVDVVFTYCTMSATRTRVTRRNAQFAMSRVDAPTYGVTASWKAAGQHHTYVARNRLVVAWALCTACSDTLDVQPVVTCCRVCACAAMTSWNCTQKDMLHTFNVSPVGRQLGLAFEGPG